MKKIGLCAVLAGVAAGALARTSGAPFEDVFFDAAVGADLQELLPFGVHDADGPSSLNVRRSFHTYLSILADMRCLGTSRTSVPELVRSWSAFVDLIPDAP